MKDRIVWMDYAKAIGIWLVVLGHFPFKGSGIIYLFHMPLFFMLSGYLFRSEGFITECRKSAKVLLVPYLMYSAFLLVPCMLMGNFQWVYALDVLLGNSECLPVYIRPLWFLLSLFIMRCVFSCSHKIKPEIIIIISICLFIGTDILDNIPNNNDYFQLQTTSLCLPFFGGVFVKEV